MLSSFSACPLEDGLAGILSSLLQRHFPFLTAAGTMLIAMVVAQASSAVGLEDIFFLVFSL